MTNAKPPGIRILLADDHAIVRDGLASLIAQKPNLEIVGEAGTGHDAVALAGSLVPDIVIMDIGMPDLNGIEATRRIKEVSSRIRVIILSMYQSKEYVSQALRAGASGYLIKNTAGSVLIEAINDVYQGKSYLSPQISQLVIDDYVVRANKLEAMQGQGSPLTSREREVLQLVAEGKISKDIAIKLRISLRTVENHRRNIMNKLKIHTTAGLVQYAIQNNILPVDKDD